MRHLLAALIVALAVPPARAQEPPLEYQVKAAYLYNFVKFVEWPAGAADGTLTICTAGRNPFGSALDDIVRGESIDGRAIAARVVAAPQAGCHVLFVPRDAPRPAATCCSFRATPRRSSTSAAREARRC